jgi:hypothetical protein
MSLELKNNSYICSEIVGGNCPMKGEVPTLSHYIFWYIFLINGTMKTINLSQGLVALVDDEDYDFLMQWKWTASYASGIFYALRNTPRPNRKTLMMHRIIMNPPRNKQIDHIDHNGLNNQRSNLRECNPSQNAGNRSKYGKNKYHGVRLDYRTYGVYIKANIKINGKLVHLGNFKTEEVAAKAYDMAAKKHFGEFATLNFKD